MKKFSVKNLKSETFETFPEVEKNLISDFQTFSDNVKNEKIIFWLLDAEADRGSDAAGELRSSWRRFNKSYTACKLRFYCCQWTHTSNVFLKVMFNR